MTRQTIITFIVVIALAAAGYLWYRYAPSGSAPGQTLSSPKARLVQLQRLQMIQLDTTLFQDPFFASLQVPPELPQLDVVPGRPNPFAPL